MERRGFARRLPDPEDRRGLTVEFLFAGLEIVDAAVEANSVSDRELSERFIREIQTLERSPRKLLAGLESPFGSLSKAPSGKDVPRRHRGQSGPGAR